MVGIGRLLSHFVACLLLGLLLGACQGVPVEDLRSYASAYQQARDGGHLLLDEVSPIVSRVVGGDSSTCPVGPQGYPECFNPQQALGSSGVRSNEDVSIRARRAALDTIAVYNSILIDLAEGKSVSQIQARIGQLTELASTVAQLGILPSGGISALIGPTATFINGLVARLERARASAAVRQALIDSGVDIALLLETLAGDTPQLYRVYVAAREVDLVNINHERNLARISKDNAAMQRAQIRLESARESVTAFHNSLTAYVRLLRQTAKSLDVLLAAAQSPMVTTASLTTLVREAVVIRTEAEAFWTAIRAVRESGRGVN